MTTATPNLSALALKLLDLIIDELGAQFVRAHLDARLDAIDADAQRKLDERFPPEGTTGSETPNAKDRVGGE